MNILIKIIALIIYPGILSLSFYFIYKNHKLTIEENLHKIICNSLIIVSFILITFIIITYFSDKLYTYDYSGHWIRSLDLKNIFHTNPSYLFERVYKSMVSEDYSYLPALFSLPLFLFKSSYLYFGICNIVCFIVPLIIYIELILIEKFESNILCISVPIIIYPIYILVFQGKPDMGGVFFICLAYDLLLLKDFEKISNSNFLLLNLICFILVFFRRWYLYSVVCIYISLFICFISYVKNYFGFKRDVLKLFLSFIPFLLVIILFFRDYLYLILNNNFQEAYQYYNQTNKILNFINYISVIVCCVCIIGLLYLIKKNFKLFLINIISIVLPCVLIFKIQTLEYHHYMIFILNILFLFSVGINLFKNYLRLVVLVCVLQSIMIFITPFKLFGFTDIKFNIEVQTNKKEILNLANELKSLLDEDWKSMYLAFGDKIICDDAIRNSNLPDLKLVNIESYVLDLRDGFPLDMNDIKYIVISDPILYLDQNYQHIYHVISDAILYHPSISKKYELIKTLHVDDIVIKVFEKNYNLSLEDKTYFYNEMIKYYPNHSDFFKHILD